MIWAAAQKLITSVTVEPSDWFFYQQEIYDYFYQRRYSIRYAQSILKFANLWGFYISKKLGHAFLPILPPRGFERIRIIDASYQKSSVRQTSAPLTPSQLNRVYGSLNRENYNWLFLSVWFGLRPQEIDNLKKRDLWRLESPSTGRKILWIYQTKIVALPPEERWKPIPILWDEQLFALQMIKAGNFKRPLTKTLKRCFGAGVHLYAGRKGFSDLMISKGHTLENINVWMGHSSLARTWQSYKSKKAFHL